ncbi:MAG: GFA family protein [Rhodospirillales bacterium]|nr:GFA family protein [Rhodospirillales bacterium]
MRTATCACGQLSVEVEGEPELVAMCGCSYCRKRTGSIYGVGAYFNVDQISNIGGDSTAFKRGSDSGRTIEGNFCTTCGTTLYWTAEIWPDRRAIAIGCFEEQDIPKPGVAVFTENVHEWAAFPEGVTIYPGARPRS